tara:strand:- start:1726 stop:1956 length:231 start_codon:yes stop_codon:yes gene_type:complete
MQSSATTTKAYYFAFVRQNGPRVRADLARELGRPPTRDEFGARCAARFRAGHACSDVGIRVLASLQRGLPPRPATH